MIQMLALLLFLLIPIQSWGAIAYEAGSSAQNTSGIGTTDVTITQCATCLVVVCTATSPAAATISDTKGETWTPLVARHDDPFSLSMTAWYAKNVSAGSNTITITVAGGSRTMVGSFSGVNTTSPLDVVAGPTNVSFTTTWASALTGVRAQADEVLVTCLEDSIDHGAGNYYTAGAGAPTYLEAFEGASYYSQMQYAIVSVTTSYSGNATAADGTNGGSIFVAAFKGASTPNAFYLRRGQ